MKKLFFSICLLIPVLAGYSQTVKENGIIYMNHPNIDAVNISQKAYVANDMVGILKFYSDTARFWASGMQKAMKIKDAAAMWSTDFDFYTDIKMTTVGYPDYLHYKDADQKVVQSWWRWEGKSKKTGEVLKIDFVQFDDFNNNGKIDFESIYGDFSKMDKTK